MYMYHIPFLTIWQYKSYVYYDKFYVITPSYRRQSFSGYITQFNIWDFSLEDYAIENIAQCRSDNWGNLMASKPENFELGSKYIKVI